MSDAILELQDLKTYFEVKEGGRTQFVKAVDGVSLHVLKGETVGLVGESGCGKSTIGRTIMRFHDPSGGKIFFDSDDITTCDMAPYRSRMQMVFQDPYSSLDPRMSVGDIVGEPLDIQFPKMNRKERSERIHEQIRLVGLNSEQLTRFPHEFSGGQRQRISIARAMVIKPEFMVLDEPVSALDISIQAQIINMLMDLQQQLGMAYLFIAHDLSVVRHISQHVVVMYLGHVMEINRSEDLYAHPLHPYTRALLSAIPVPDPKVSRARKREILQGDVPSPINPPAGCVFSTRCRYATEQCRMEAPRVQDVGDGHKVACHRFAQID
ncbi:oligopeptide/dipeptide ABC transporter ATP-binding protein [Beduinella massiliensis]|uniref:oligopeptide/dipeptide ABC transporter ATP-binding protein n=1 Tax=Beduinella massiliensis TaxID=1852363 RepID=UPI000C82EDFA